MEASRAKTNGHHTADGVFEPGQMLTMAALRKRCGWGDWAVRQAKKDGLVVRKIGNTRFVMSDDLIRFVTERGTVEGSNGRNHEEAIKGSGENAAVEET